MGAGVHGTGEWNALDGLIHVTNLCCGPTNEFFSSLRAGEQTAGAALLWDCTFGNYSSMQRTTPRPGDVKIENANCIVLSNSKDAPEVFDEQLLETLGPWWLQGGSGYSAAPSGVSVDTTPFEDWDFLFESDSTLTELVAQQAEVCK